MSSIQLSPKGTVICFVEMGVISAMVYAFAYGVSGVKSANRDHTKKKTLPVLSIIAGIVLIAVFCAVLWLALEWTKNNI